MGTSLALFAGAAALTYILATCIYRTLFHPLSHVPGPKWAAITQGYEMYHDLILKARFPWQIQKLHKTFGPIVCIAPNEFGMPESTFNTINADMHKMMRHAVAPFFSRRKSKTPVDLRLLFSCFTTDIITQYAFPNCFGLLADPDLAPVWRRTFAEGLRNFQWFKHFPSLWTVLRSIPDKMLVKMAPQMAITQNWERSNQKLPKTENHVTIFHELLASDLPKHEKSYERLWQEGLVLIGAGVETTSNTFIVALYHLSFNPSKLSHLKKELEEAMPDSKELAPWAKQRCQRTERSIRTIDPNGVFWCFGSNERTGMVGRTELRTNALLEPNVRLFGTTFDRFSMGILS
ncbi:cytochrome P450 [Bimuria novae-zelandiae CBS 107.79]|uniref:Cytochrome P450 n=1 Tax=Bimuria novae-zelandiae CBS 107.79 TaxID=1447943 RepID=A0A6A5VEV9_9PLEO|nr:cytochrome P450 [Bimuria novae-zelandiae CBS 107.79]